jgi:hypothetical protein
MNTEKRVLVNCLAHNNYYSSLSLRIADVNISILSQDSELKIGVDGVAKQFLIEQANPDATVQASLDNQLAEVKGKRIFDSESLWQLYCENSSYVFRFTSLALGSLPYKVASFNQDFTKGEISLNRSYFDSEQPIYPLEYPLDELLVINLLAQGKGVEVHACGIVDSNGNGQLFVGQSEAGKTTMAKLWQNEPGITILSDDRIILRKADKKIWMYGTPWHGEAMLASPARVPLTKICFLRKGLKNELIRLRNSAAVGQLISCSFVPFYNPEAIDFTLGFLGEVVETAPCYEFSFFPDKRVVEFIKGSVSHEVRAEIPEVF